MPHSLIYERIKELCSANGITISQLELDLGFGKSSIKKWGNPCSPSIDKVQKVAKYFNVSSDYIVGSSTISTPAEKILNDSDIITLHRCFVRMTPDDRVRANNMLQAAFEYAFNEQEKHDD